MSIDKNIDEALAYAVKHLDLTDIEVNEILISSDTGTNSVKDNNLESEGNLIIIDVYSKLFKLLNSNDHIKKFIRSNNKYFNEKPIIVMKTQGGLKEFQNYLINMLAKY